MFRSYLCEPSYFSISIFQRMGKYLLFLVGTRENILCLNFCVAAPQRSHAQTPVIFQGFTCRVI